MKKIKGWVLALVLWFAIGGAVDVQAQQKPQHDHPMRAPESAEAFRPLTPEEIDDTLNYMQELDPQAAERLQTLRDENPATFRRQIGRVHQRMMRMQALKKRDPQRHARQVEIQQLESTARQLGRQIREAQPPQAAELKNELQEVLGTLFDLRENERQHEVEKLEQRLESLKERLAERQKNRDEIIQKRLEQMSTDAKTTRWD
ncbi:hypothetical protein JW992_09685 [candidate division KSB1 bacterium]|nr:hypothetical protein [candidate division KSB1 bacterium]